MLVFVAIVIIFFLFLGLRYVEQKMIYFPIPFPEGYWDISLFPGQIEDCSFQAEDGTRLHGWFVHAVNPRNDSISTLLFFHGNAGNLSHRITNITYLIQLGINVFIFDYRGYGKSEGKPDEEGLYMDAIAAYRYLISRDDVDTNRIVFFGRSIGGAVAVELAVKKPCEKLILESTFTSINDMTKEMFGGLPIHYVVHSKFDSLTKIGQIHIPLLSIHGTHDTIVPFEQGKRLFAAANEPKWFYEIEGADHNDTYDVGGDAYFERLSWFLHTDFQS